MVCVWRSSDLSKCKQKTVTLDHCLALKMIPTLDWREDQRYSQQGKTWHSWVYSYRLCQSCIVTLYIASLPSSQQSLYCQKQKIHNYSNNNKIVYSPSFSSTSSSSIDTKKTTAPKLSFCSWRLAFTKSSVEGSHWHCPPRRLPWP